MRPGRGREREIERGDERDKTSDKPSARPKKSSAHLHMRVARQGLLLTSEDEETGGGGGGGFSRRGSGLSISAVPLKGPPRDCLIFTISKGIREGARKRSKCLCCARAWQRRCGGSPSYGSILGHGSWRQEGGPAKGGHRFWLRGGGGDFGLQEGKGGIELEKSSKCIQKCNFFGPRKFCTF